MNIDFAVSDYIKLC